MSNKLWVTFGIVVVIMCLLGGIRALYNANEQLKLDNVTLELNIKSLTDVNRDLNDTIERNTETVKSIDNTTVAIAKMSDDIQSKLTKTTSSIKSQIKGLPCYEQTIPADAIDAVCIMQPSNSACYDHDTRKSDHGATINASPTKTN